jgi:hypothetical protein
MTTPQDTRPRLRPLSLGEILDVSIKIVIRNGLTLFKAVLLVVVPVQIVSTLLTADYTVSSFDFSANADQTPEEALEELNQYLGGLVISTILQALAVLLASAACFRAIAQAYLGEKPDWRSSLSYGLQRAPSLLLLSLLYGIGVVVGTILFIAPGVWLYVAWAFGMLALLVEGLRGRAALRRSFELVKGRWWRTFGIILLGFILVGVFSSIVQAVFLIGIVFEPDNRALVLILSGLSGAVGLIIGTPFQAALLTVLYFDLRVRKEGFDLELLAQGIGGSVPAVPVASGPSPLLPSDKEAQRGGDPRWPAPPGSADPPWPAPPGSADPPWPAPDKAGASDPSTPPRPRLSKDDDPPGVPQA